MKQRKPYRRLALSLAVLAAMAPAFGPGCGGGFAPISEIDGLRVISVVADKPYAAPGDTVNFELTYGDGSSQDRPPPTIVWLGGCFDPPGDQYYGCYEQLAALFQEGFDPANPPPGLVGFGPKFSLTLPEDIISRRPPAPDGTPQYGVAFVFFAVCAGNLGAVPSEGDSAAGSFPLGCFDPVTKERLGADSFVPGITQVFTFADGRTNKNPTIKGLKLEGEAIADGPGGAVDVEACPVSEEDRLGPPGCGKANPYQDCAAYDLTVDVPKNVAEIDPQGEGSDGKPLREVVWVDYFADKGSIDSPTRLVNDATTGFLSKHGTLFVPPAEEGLVNLWAVVRDARGGEAVIHRYVNVKKKQ